jgi:hypothetical protein
VTHIVIYDREPGAPVYHRVDSLEAAVAEVERLRNVDGITESDIFELQPVTYRFQPYFRVALDDEDAWDAEDSDGYDHTYDEGGYDGGYDQVAYGDERADASYADARYQDGVTSGVNPIDLRADEKSGFTTYPIGRRLFAR